LKNNSEWLLFSQWSPYRDGKSKRNELSALKNLLSEADLILSTTKLPENRTARCRELRHPGLALTDDLLSEPELSAATMLGRKGGSVIAKRGSAYFRKASRPAQDSRRRKTAQGIGIVALSFNHTSCYIAFAALVESSYRA